MRFTLITALFALSAPVLSLVSSTQNSDPIAYVNSLQASALPYENNINETITALGSKPNSQQQAAAALSVNNDLQSIYSILSTTVIPQNLVFTANNTQGFGDGLISLFEGILELGLIVVGNAVVLALIAVTLVGLLIAFSDPELNPGLGQQQTFVQLNHMITDFQSVIAQAQ